MTDATPGNTTSSAPSTSGDWQAAIAYLNLLWIYTAWAKSDSPTHMWHAKNGAGLSLTYIVLYVVMNILVTVLPVGMVGLLGLIMSIINLLVVIASLWGAWNAWKGKQWTLPVITNIGQKIPLEKWFHKGAAAPAASAPAAAAPTPTPTPAPTPAPEPTPAPVAPAAPAAPTEPTPPTPPQTPAA